MSITIQIKNIGPIKDTGNIELSRFNVIIGKQSSGKSTFLKILSFCQWLEKKIMVDEEMVSNYTHYLRFLKELKQFHRLNDDFFSGESEIHYKGEGLFIDWVGVSNNARIQRSNDFNAIKHNTKLSFIPSERNMVSVMRNVDKDYKSKENDLIFNHIFEWGEAKEHTSNGSPVDLGMVGNMEYFYDSDQGCDFIRLKDRHLNILPFYASSGVQSVLPIAVMVSYFTSDSLFDRTNLSKYDVDTISRKIIDATGSNAESINITDELKKFTAIKKYQNTKLFIEEPEQNLFPESQQNLVNYIVENINHATLHTEKESSLTITTHSPYIITAFNVLLKGAEAFRINPEATKNIVPESCLINSSDIRAYYISSGTLINIYNEELNMISGVDLDRASEIVEDTLSDLNDIIYE